MMLCVLLAVLDGRNWIMLLSSWCARCPRERTSARAVGMALL